MKIRIAIDEDIPKIVELLKLSLGESLMPKSEEYWRWKHIQNPFGASPVLVAEENEELVGVRAFMKWQWMDNSTLVNAIRAVDTATHPDYQGKGVFKKLTLELLDHCMKQGDDFVFNTPNIFSKPGYLKMGWVEAGKLPIKLRIKRPLNVLKSKIMKSSKINFLVLDDTTDFDLAKSIDTYEGSYSRNTESFHTPLSYDYLNWRYLKIPLIRYYGHAEREGMVIFRLKQTTNGTELRITDCVGDMSCINELIRKIYQTLEFDFMSISNKVGNRLRGLIQLNATGPMVTVRELGSFKIQPLITFQNWSPSLGDLEVF